MAMTGCCAVGYLAMYCGAGRVTVEGRDVFWMRYVDWLVATETFLFGLTMLSGTTWRHALYVLGLDFVGVACALVGAMIPAVKVPAFVLGAVVFALYNVTLFGPMQASAALLGDGVARRYKRICTFAMASWCVYPCLYMLCEMTRSVGETAEVLLYAICDCNAKCVVAVGLLYSPAILRDVAGGSETGKRRLLGP
uniref:Uncharacterized protein n=1 Tax=Zooxanthella nutricula TaxID=1333877 RepID=A0A7S2IAA1_9DINO